MTLNWWVERQAMVHLYNGIPFSNKKELSSETYNIDKPQKHYTNRKKWDTKKLHIIWSHLCEILEKEFLKVTESRSVVFRNKGVGEGI